MTRQGVSAVMLVLCTLCFMGRGEPHDPWTARHVPRRHAALRLERLRGGCSASTSSASDESSEFEQRGWGDVEGEQQDDIAYDMEITYWKTFYEDLTTTTKSLCKLADKLLDHGSAMIQHAIASSQASFDEVMNFAGEAECDDMSNPPAAMMEEFEKKVKEMRLTLTVNLGIAILALKKFKKADEILHQLNFLLNSKIVDELQEYLQGLKEKKSIKLSKKEMKKRDDRKMDMLYIDFCLSLLEVDKAAVLAQASGIQLSKSLHQYEKAYRVLQSLQGGDLLGLLKWCNKHKEKLLQHDSTMMLISQTHLQQVQQLCYRGDHAAACDFVRWWYDELSQDSPAFPQLLLNDVNMRRFPVDGVEVEKLKEKLKEKPWTGIAEASSLAVRSSFWLLLFKPHSEFDWARRLYGDIRWTQLQDSLKKHAYLIHGGCSSQSYPLLPSLFAMGLLALKTKNQYSPSYVKPQVDEEDFKQPGSKEGKESKEERDKLRCMAPVSRNRDPLHRAFYRIAKDLPMMAVSNSVMLCSYTRKVMDEDDPPCALPNGRLVAKSVAMKIADEIYGKDLSLSTWLDLDFVIGEYELARPPQSKFRICQVIVT
ncbi:hypothetical protein GUITHDRAFT_145102 [Guillardia theta CCMP2712]|uniref:CTLH/CRA C-terminal to LisH motif domain-containing protein n=1 Tax=Guillardia theta (strain CCMP2712) TaxID=905079 RepID=L1IN84_GUITC|nr:hypothetical protein GUITHDRAFT_145102 [Guillardia theta CCMP2712]EKX37260.1 hypothetical protein GUITHDRAFT_145102 [Guillardia theta CCMP2712]|eukprot:XP_005824240.1 hypothetical protein GUITHDRAFT_145102 [Guillardia theta CCMP2712]